MSAMKVVADSRSLSSGERVGFSGIAEGKSTSDICSVVCVRCCRCVEEGDVVVCDE